MYVRIKVKDRPQLHSLMCYVYRTSNELLNMIIVRKKNRNKCNNTFKYTWGYLKIKKN